MTDDDFFEIRRWFLWLPVWIALGDAYYFSLWTEPNLRTVFPIALSVSTFLIYLKRIIRKSITKSANFTKTYKVLMIFLFCINALLGFTAGLCAAKMHTFIVDTPQITAPLHDLHLTASVEDVEDVARGTISRPRIVRRCRLRLSGDSLGLNSAPVYIRVQSTYKKLKNIHPGDTVTLLADIWSPPEPISLHGYNASFDVYFKGITALGKVQEVLAVQRDSPQLLSMTWWERMQNFLKKKRITLTDRLRRSLPGDVAPLATALITGDKSGITLNMRENFNRAGISHMLAISGLHMGLLASMIFLIFSKLCSLISPFATRFVVKKAAALFTVPVTLMYLLLSGASFSAMRAFLMVSLSMIAVIIDQKPISLRCTAAAASCILLIFPESLFSVSFQLSFAAVTALCCAYESDIPRRLAEHLVKSQTDERISLLQKRLISLRNRSIRFITYSLISTLVATLATTPFILFVFQRTTLVGIFGNLIAIPYLSFVVVPLAFLAILSLLFSSGMSPFLTLWGMSLKGLASIAEYVANLPGSDFLLPKPSYSSLILLVLSALWWMIWQQKKRWFAVIPLMISLFGFFRPQLFDIYLTHYGEIIGVRTSETFYISNPRQGGFHAKVWSQECGLRKIIPMSLDTARCWRDQLAPYLKELRSADDVLFLKRRGASYCTVLLRSHAKQRPWISPYRP